MDDLKYIGMDVHQTSIVAVVLDASGKVVMESILETRAETVLQFIAGLSGTLWVTFEEGISAAWLHDLDQIGNEKSASRKLATSWPGELCSSNAQRWGEYLAIHSDHCWPETIALGNTFCLVAKGLVIAEGRATPGTLRENALTLLPAPCHRVRVTGVFWRQLGQVIDTFARSSTTSSPQKTPDSTLKQAALRAAELRLCPKAAIAEKWTPPIRLAGYFSGSPTSRPQRRFARCSQQEPIVIKRIMLAVAAVGRRRTRSCSGL